MKVSVEIAQGKYVRLRWSYQGKPVCISLGMFDSPLARAYAQQRAAIIEGDILSGNYDPTLLKYKPLTGKRGTVVSAVHSGDFKTLFVSDLFVIRGIQDINAYL